MNIYRQNDPQWAGILIGNSPYFMGPYGCLTTAHAIAFSLAGWNITPGNICIHAELYTDANYPAGAGLLLWGNVGTVFPQYHLHLDDTGHYKFRQVIAQFPSGYRGEHWVLDDAGTIYDPLYGTETLSMPSNYRPTGLVRSADIDLAPLPVNVPVTFQVIVNGPLGSANFRTEPKTGDNIAVNYPNGSTIDCIDTVTGQTLSITWPGGITVTTDKWYKSSLHGYYISAAVSTHN